MTVTDTLREYGPSSVVGFLTGAAAKVTGVLTGALATLGTLPGVGPALEFVAADGRFWLAATTIWTRYVGTSLSSGMETALIATVAVVVVVAKIHDKYLDYKDDE